MGKTEKENLQFLYYCTSILKDRTESQKRRTKQQLVIKIMIWKLERKI